MQPALTNPVDLGVKDKQEVVSTEQEINAVPMIGIDLLTAINQTVSRSSDHGEIMDTVAQAMENNVGMANRPRLEPVQMEPWTNVNRVKRREKLHARCELVQVDTNCIN